MIRYAALLAVTAALAFSGCQVQSGDVKEIKDELKSIKENQTKILAAVEKIKGGAAAPARPKRPQPDFNKVHNLPTGNSPFKGAAKGLVTVTEFSDFQ
jgi:protein-disulfide isomerase